MGYLKSIGTTIIYIGAFLALITFIPGLPPDSHCQEYSFPEPKKLTGKLAINDKLNNAEILFKGQVHGPESFASYNGELYTGVQGGYIVKVTKTKLVPIVKVGKDCDGIWQQSKCGRVLGMKFDKSGILYFSDTYYGLYKVDVKTGKYEKIISLDKPIDGKVPMIMNSLDIASNGDIYWTDSSTEFTIQDGFYTMLTNPTGRLFYYNAATKKNQLLMQDLAFANGIHLSHDEQFVIVVETTSHRIIKYHLKGPKAGKSEVFIESLPGYPDNVHSDNKNGFLVSLVGYADQENPSLSTSLAPHPFIRRMIIRLINLIDASFKCLHNYYPNPYAEKVINFIGGFESILPITSPITVVLRIDNKGIITDALYSTNENITSISSAFIHDGYLWLGSPFNQYLARVPLNNVFPDLAAEEKYSQSTKSTEQVKKNSIPNSEKQVKPITTTTAPKPVKTKPVETKPVETKPVEIKPVETKSVTPKPVQSKATTVKPIESKTTTAKPVESKTSTVKPVESKTSTVKPVESKTTKSNNAKKTTTEQQSSQSNKKVSLEK